MADSPKSYRIRSRHKVLAVLAIVWVGLGLQPCAVAAVSHVDCPHRTAGHAEPMAHHDHGSGQDNEHCDVAASSCCAADAIAVDCRTNPVKGDDNSGIDALPAAPIHYLSLEPDRPPDRQFAAAAGPPPGRPLHVLHCVYLD